ncbi:MAG: hypothetical protein ACT443_11240 [Gemmatimonadota bacterium]
MAIPWVPVPEGTRVRIRQIAEFPQDPAVLGRNGTVVMASEYHTQSVGVVLDGEVEPRYFAPGELEIRQEPALPPEREAAKQRRALP